MSDQVLRSNLIRLASEKPELRQHLLPLLKQASEKGTYNARIIQVGQDFSKEFTELLEIALSRAGANSLSLTHNYLFNRVSGEHEKLGNFEIYVRPVSDRKTLSVSISWEGRKFEKSLFWEVYDKTPQAVVPLFLKEQPVNALQKD